MKKIFSLTIILTFVILSIPKIIYGINMNSSNYKIQFGNLNIGATPQTSANYLLGVSMGQTAAQEFTSAGYTVKAGFQYLHSIIPFAFSVSNTHVNLGTLTPSTFATGTTVLTISEGGAGGYQVATIENNALKTLLGTSIPDTQCDSGTPCTTPLTAQVWTNTGRYGFGYNMTGNDISADFTNSTYFRPFPDRSGAVAPAVIMSSAHVGVARQATMTLKVNVSGVQEAGSYFTVLDFIATPKY